MKNMKRNIRKSYKELIEIKNFEDRVRYLCLHGIVGDITFGGHRYLNQILYQSYRWKSVRREVIIRDNGCDLAHEQYPIDGSVYVHHLNPITIDDILEERSCVFDLDNLISSSFKTHNAIHYGLEEYISSGYVERRKNDTCLWR